AGTVFVGGNTAENVDFIDVMNQWLPIVLVFVLGLSFLLLTLAFRSVLLAGTASRLNPPPPGPGGRPPLPLPASGHDRGLGSAVPVRGALRALDGLPGVPAQPDPR